jgi:hypothetical protein
MVTPGIAGTLRHAGLRAARVSFGERVETDVDGVVEVQPATK